MARRLSGRQGDIGGMARPLRVAESAAVEMAEPLRVAESDVAEAAKLALRADRTLTIARAATWALDPRRRLR